MPHSIFDARPWFDQPAPVPRLIGMLGKNESSLFYHLAKDLFTGQGTIVDAGSFLGKSAFAFAQGLRANPRFDAAKHRVHCFDDFVCHDDATIEIVGSAFGPPLRIGQSTRDLFERQVAPVRDLLEVHAGDFHGVAWPREPIEILMVDIAKTPSLGRRVVEVFFGDLIPGHSILVHQDYHHPWLPHIHVVMEYLADCFEIVAMRVDDSAAFMLKKAIPAPMLAKAIAQDFTPKEQLELMDRAIARIPQTMRDHVELARLVLLHQSGQGTNLAAEFESFKRRYPDAQSGGRKSYFERVRGLFEVLEADAHLLREDFVGALAIADGLLARRTRVAKALETRATALLALGRRGEAELALEEARQQPLVHGEGRASLARIYASIGRIDDAERLLIDDMRDPELGAGRRAPLCDELCAIWERNHRPEHEDRILEQLRRDLPAETEVDLLAARSSFLRGDRTAALQQLQSAMRRGATEERCTELLAPLGLTPDDAMRMREA